MTRVPDHLVSVALAIRDHGLTLELIDQSGQPFDLTPDRPAMVLIGDDTDTAKGPEGFDRPSLVTLAKGCKAHAVIGCEALPAIYGRAVAFALRSGSVPLVIETRPEQEIPWITFLQAHAPGTPLLWGTVNAATA